MSSARRRALRVDANQAEIVAWLESYGCVVYIIGHPVDLLVGYNGSWALVEVKDGSKPPSRRKLRQSQLECFARCRDAGLPHALVESLDDARAMITRWPLVDKQMHMA